MSLIDEEQLTRVGRKAQLLRSLPRSTFKYLCETLNKGINLVWDDEDPQAVIDELGEHALELISLQSALADFLEALKPGCTASIVAKIKPYEVVDGHVVVTPA